MKLIDYEKIIMHDSYDFVLPNVPQIKEGNQLFSKLNYNIATPIHHLVTRHVLHRNQDSVDNFRESLQKES